MRISVAPPLRSCFAAARRDGARHRDGPAGAARWLALLLALCVAGCASPPHRQVSALQRGERAPRIVLMPPDVELRQLNAGGTQETQAEWTAAAHRNIAAAFAAEGNERRVRFVEFAPGRGSAADQASARELASLHRVVAESVLTHEYTPKLALPARVSFDWSLGPDAAAIARAQDADYALFFAVRDSYATTGRYAVMAARMLLWRIPMGVPAGAQVGYASLVDLKTGDIVWFNQLSRGTGGLRTPEDARETVRKLLTDLPP